MNLFIKQKQTHRHRFIETREAYDIQGPMLQDSGVNIKKKMQKKSIISGNFKYWKNSCHLNA